MKESELLRLVMDWLSAQHIFSLRMNTGAIKVDARLVRFGVPGMADILAFTQSPCSPHEIEVIWIELKAKSNRQSELQKSFQLQVQREGHRYVVAYCLEDVQEAFR